MKLTDNFCYISVWGISICYIILVSFSTSPFFYLSNVDSEIFQYEGFAMFNGHIPYTDLFDHKGIFLYFINGLGLLLGGVFAIQVMQMLNLGFTMSLLFYSTKDLATNGYRFICVILTMLCLYLHYYVGNMTEEWSLLYIAIPLAIYFVHLKEKYIPNKWLFVMGLSLGIHLVLRANNAMPLFGVLLFCFVKGLLEKEYKYLLRAAGLIFVGGIVPITIAIIGFYMVGGAEGVHDMFYGMFLFNMDYMHSIKIREFADILHWGKYLYKIALPFLFVLPLCWKEKEKVMPLIIGACASVFSIGVYMFPHYLMIFIPLVFICLVMIGKYRWKYICLAIMAIPYLFEAIRDFKIDNYKSHSYHDTYVSTFQDVVKSIPADQRSEIWNGTGHYFMRGFMEEGLVQSNRLLLPFQLHISKELQDSETDKIRKVKPEYVLWADFNKDVQSDEWLYKNTSTEEDVDYLKKNYHIITSSRCDDGTVLYCYKRNE